MSARAVFFRWLATFLAFPLGGLLAVLTVGPVTDPLRAALAGALAGAILGAAQWLALRPAGLGPAWVGVTSAAMALGSALAVVVTHAATTTVDLVGQGLVTGALVGAGQALAVRAGVRRLIGWALLVSASWGLAWFITANVIVDAERGYIVFGSSGALLATLLTGLFVSRLVGAGGADPTPAPGSGAASGTEAVR